MTDLIRAGVVQLATGAWYDPAEPGRVGAVDKHGNPNVLTLDKGTSKLAQAPAAPAPKVTITGTIDQIGTYTSNMSKYDLNYGRGRDDEMYGRTRGRFDVVGEIGKAKAVLGIEIDAYYGQTSNSD